MGIKPRISKELESKLSHTEAAPKVTATSAVEFETMLGLRSYVKFAPIVAFTVPKGPVKELSRLSIFCNRTIVLVVSP